jgi:anti-sigma regulatory factor (Ser/Thr protein kinase)
MHETHHLAHTPASVSVARHELRGALEREGVGESVVYDATLVLSELVSNAVQHGRPTRDGSIEVGWSLEDDRLVLDVRDGGQGKPHALPVDVESDRGRGLVIVGEVCRSWRVDHVADGTRVTAELVLAVA